jgi:NAD(P) transhydrogenase subunit alpha
MSPLLLADLTVFTLALLVGFEVISKVPATLHTPLMSGANSIHGVVVIGALLVTSTARGPLGYTIAFFAVALAAMNVVGGYAVTDRMLEMFKAKPAARPADAPADPSGNGHAS